jgi:hypothetical protein
MRMITRRLMLLGGAALGGATLAQRVSAQADPARGRVTGRSFTKLPPRQTIIVSPLDDRPENLRIAAAISRQLERAGHVAVASDAAWRLSFDSEVRPVAGQPPARPRAALPSTDGRSAPETGAPASLPDRPLRPAPVPGRGGAPVAQLRYVINAVLEETATGKRAWQGSVRYDDAESDRARMLLRLVEPMMEAFARNQTARAFSLE